MLLEYDFIVVYKSGKIHVVVDVLFRLLNTTKPIGGVEQTTDASLFFIEPKWLNDVRNFLTYMTNGRVFVNKDKKKWLAMRVEPFTRCFVQDGIGQ